VSQPFILVGDKTSHGGTVISGDVSFTIHGKPVARVGDMTSCPKCRGQFAITSGLSGFTSMDHPPAVHGDKTACGATLIGSTPTSTADNTSGSAAGASSDSDSPTAQGDASGEQAGQGTVGTSAISAQAPTVCLECLAQAAANGTAMVVRD
jgi:uncharacterized Zn-binding protein involved in type VI secretion